jgi:hypothetical protein
MSVAATTQSIKLSLTIRGGGWGCFVAAHNGPGETLCAAPNSPATKQCGHREGKRSSPRFLSSSDQLLKNRGGRSRAVLVAFLRQLELQIKPAKAGPPRAAMMSRAADAACSGVIGCSGLSVICALVESPKRALGAKARSTRKGKGLLVYKCHIWKPPLYGGKLSLGGNNGLHTVCRWATNSG